METAPKFTRHTWSQLWRISKPFFSGGSRRRAWSMFATLVALSLTVTWVGVKANEANGTFVTALQKKNPEGYYQALWIYVATFLASIPCTAYYRYVEERLALAWRENLTLTLMKRYFNNRAFYHLGACKDIDNPDQRISEDVRNFTITTLSFFLILMNSAIQAVAYTGVLWAITPRLVYVLYGYAAIGTLIAILIGRRLIGLNYLQYSREADMRYGLVRVRDHAESIAFFRGERREFRDLRKRLAAVTSNLLGLIRWNRNLAFFTTGYNSFALIVPVIVVAPLYLAGKNEFGDITRSMGAFSVVLAAVSMIITQFERLSAFAAGVTRLGSLWDRLDEHDAEDDVEAEAETIEIDECECTISMEKLSVKTPGGGRLLLRDLNLEVPTGHSVLIMGQSGTGKSSLLRTIAGLWSCGSGAIRRPQYRYLMFLPQRPYVNRGTLREQLEYPDSSCSTPDARLKEVLKEVHLSEILDRVEGDFDEVADWGEMLSLGEQQRLSFARLLLRKPAIAFLDESTSALDEPNERHLYQILRDRRQTYLSVGHRSTLKEFHDQLLTIEPGGSWKLENIPSPASRRSVAAR